MKDSHGLTQEEREMLGLNNRSLRDWFAGQAMPWATPYAYSNGGSFEFKPEVIAKAAYAIADAMLAEREKE